MDDPADGAGGGAASDPDPRQKRINRYNADMQLIRELIAAGNRAALLQPTFFGFTAFSRIMMGRLNQTAGTGGPPVSVPGWDSVDKKSFFKVFESHPLEYRRAVFGVQGDNHLAGLQAAVAYDQSREVFSMLLPVAEVKQELTRFEVKEILKAARLFNAHPVENIRQAFLWGARKFFVCFLRNNLSEEIDATSGLVASISSYLGTDYFLKLVYVRACLSRLQDEASSTFIDKASEKIKELEGKFAEHPKSMDYIDSWLKIIFCELLVSLIKNRSPLVDELWHLQEKLGIVDDSGLLFFMQIAFAAKFSLQENIRLVRTASVSWPESFVEVLKSNPLLQAVLSLLNTDQAAFVSKAVEEFPVLDSGLDRANILIKIIKLESTMTPKIKELINKILSDTRGRVCSEVIFDRIPEEPKFYELKVYLLSKTSFSNSVFRFLSRLREEDINKYYQALNLFQERLPLEEKDIKRIDVCYVGILRHLVAIDNFLSDRRVLFLYRASHIAPLLPEGLKKYLVALIEGLRLDWVKFNTPAFVRMLKIFFFSVCVKMRDVPGDILQLVNDNVDGFKEEISFVENVVNSKDLGVCKRAGLIVDISSRYPCAVTLVMDSSECWQALNHVSDVGSQDIVFEAIRSLCSPCLEVEKLFSADVWELMFPSDCLLQRMFSSIRGRPSDFILRIGDFLWQPIVSSRQCMMDFSRNILFKAISKNGIGLYELSIYLLSKIPKESLDAATSPGSGFGDLVCSLLVIIFSKDDKDQFHRAFGLLSIECRRRWAEKNCPEQVEALCKTIAGANELPQSGQLSSLSVLTQRCSDGGAKLDSPGSRR